MIYKLSGVVQHYDWGGYELLPLLLKLENADQQPWAEYWMGTHSKGCASIEVNGVSEKLSSFLNDNPDCLGEKVKSQFGSLPFLFKILDVRQMLSIQLHPTKQKAVVGFEKEEKLGIPRLAGNRNYKDQNHKPEIMVALSDFWLLHGFKPEETIASVLKTVPAWDTLLPVLSTGGIKGLYEKVMSMPQAEVNDMLTPLFQNLKQKLENTSSGLDKNKADYWAWQAFENYTRDENYDRGIFSIYFFNLLQLKEGEGIFQGAGIPHAYLEGANIELMANSDNVLRGGLTPKHIDVPELLDNIVAEAVIPKVLKATQNELGITNYPALVDDFSLDKISLTANKTLKLAQKGPAMFLVYGGDLTVNGQTYHTGEAFFVGDNTTVLLEQKGNNEAVVFRAYV